MPFTDQYREAGRAYLYSSFTIVFGMYLLLGSEFPPRFMAFFLFLVPVFFVAGRTAINMSNLLVQKKGYGRHNSMILNWDGVVTNLPERFALFPELGYRVCAFVCTAKGIKPCDPRHCTLQVDFAQLRLFRREPRQDTLPCYKIEDLADGIEEEQIERLFVPLMKPVADGFADIVRICLDHKVKLKLISHESEELLRFSKVKDIAGISLYSPPKRITNRLKAQAKRIFDVCGSLLLLLISSPLLALVVLAILIEDGRPVLFQQRRASMKGGKTFDLFKFRSMVKSAEFEQKGLSGLNQTEGGLFLLKMDPRITKVGRWIRKFSIDEFPQLINVIKGEMSLVGPRPLAMLDLENILPDNDFAGYYYLRDNIRPGITGLWQICGRREVPFREMVLLDLYYIENQSILFDLEILFATIPVMLFGRGAY
jgi:lipopolysaccharide/colanic/teichoic acid biosynthesis glycosyltransferase